VIRAYAHLSAFLEPVRSAPLYETRFRMQLFFHLEVHMLAVFIQTSHAGKQYVGRAVPGYGESTTGVGERHSAGDKSCLSALQHVLYATREACAHRLLEQGADVEADVQRTSAERFH